MNPQFGLRKRKKIMTKPLIKIAVVSDVVCPWCYIGKRRLEKAVDQLKDRFDFDIAYYPFELNPEAPVSGIDNKKHLTEKFGSEAAYAQLTGNVARVAASEGLQFNFEKQKISPNTRNAHRLLLLAREYGKQLELTEAFFKAYFSDGVDLSKNESLQAIAAGVGLPGEKVKIFLESDTGRTEVVAAEKELQSMGITGVPFYIINDKYGVSGAQPTSAFLSAFENIGKEITTAESCDVDQKNC
jgi:predicted DsbA family dithiol-disulfide isomerase